MKRMMPRIVRKLGVKTPAKVPMVPAWTCGFFSESSLMASRVSSSVLTAVCSRIQGRIQPPSERRLLLEFCLPGMI
jgi:hypothetical protein